MIAHFFISGQLVIFDFALFILQTTDRNQRTCMGAGRRGRGGPNRDLLPNTRAPVVFS